jgi:Tfp pilus assembly protein PilO
VSAFFQRLLRSIRRNPLLSASIVVIVACGAASGYLWNRQQSLGTVHEQLQRNGEAMIQSLASHARVSAEITKVEEAVAFIDRNLINEGDLAQNIGYFYEIEAASRIKFTQVSQMSSQPQPADRPFKTVPFSLRTTGSYRQLLRVLRELENGPRLLRIRTFNLDAERGDPERLTLDLTVELLARP